MTPSAHALASAAQPLRVLRQLAERLEESVEGSLKQALVSRLIETLADLSRTLDGPADLQSVPADAGAVSSSEGPPTGENASPWTGLLAQLGGPGDRLSPMIAVVDRDPAFRSAIRLALEAEGLTVEAFDNCDAFLEARATDGPACLIIDSNLPGMAGLKLLRTLSDQGQALPVIVVAGPGEVRTAVDALKAGVVDFLEKPICRKTLLDSVEHALVRGRESRRLTVNHDAAANRLLHLTPRQRQVMDMILAGHPSKNIAADIGISQRTVESHRAEVMRKTGVRSMPALARFAAVAASGAAAPLSFHFESARP